MANTIVQYTLQGSSTDLFISRLIQITSDGSQETNTVIFDNDTFSNNPLLGRLLYLESSGSAATITLLWDATTPTKIVTINPNNIVQLDFNEIGGGRNPKAAGCTGDILVTTAGLSSGEVLYMLLKISQN